MLVFPALGAEITQEMYYFWTKCIFFLQNLFSHLWKKYSKTLSPIIKDYHLVHLPVKILKNGKSWSFSRLVAQHPSIFLVRKTQKDLLTFSGEQG